MRRSPWRKFRGRIPNGVDLLYEFPAETRLTGYRRLDIPPAKAARLGPAKNGELVVEYDQVSEVLLDHIDGSAQKTLQRIY